MFSRQQVKNCSLLGEKETGYSFFLFQHPACQQDTWIKNETVIMQADFSLGTLSLQSAVYGLSGCQFMHLIVFNTQKDGPILHEYAEFFSNPFKLLWELPGHFLLVSM